MTFKTYTTFEDRLLAIDLAEIATIKQICDTSAVVVMKGNLGQNADHSVTVSTKLAHQIASDRLAIECQMANPKKARDMTSAAIKKRILEQEEYKGWSLKKERQGDHTHVYLITPSGSYMAPVNGGHEGAYTARGKTYKDALRRLAEINQISLAE